MKKFKRILCIFNLFLFLGSFTLLSYSAFSSSSNFNPQNLKRLVVSPTHNSVNNNLIQLSEENETENDDDFEIEALELPFILSQIQNNAKAYIYSCNHSLVENVSDPIYIRVCNFRV